MSVWYRAGTVAVTNGSKTVTGTNTQWLNLMFGVMPGTTFYGPDGKPYEVDRVVSNTSLLLVTDYSGATASGQAYSVDPTRSGSVASLAAQTSEVLKFSQEQFTQMQTWVTGAANVDVTLKAPSGQTVEVPSWKKISDTVSGQAAAAKDEADRAEAAADRAAGIVAASSLPLPDLCAPLTDDVRLITGYGRDVKVGEDVVARFLDFSRLTAATVFDREGLPIVVPPNAPRFDNGWLVFEGPATNLVPFGEDFTQWGGYGAHSIEKQPGIFTKITPSAYNSGRLITVGGLVAGASYVLSFWAYTVPNAPAGQFNIGAEVAGARINSLTAAAARYSIPFVAPGVGVNIIAYGAIGSGAPDPFYVGGFQVESGDEATSYIPTSGAAATRAADVMSVKKENFPAGDFSIAVEVGTLRSVGQQSAHVYRENVSLLRLRREEGSDYISVPTVNVPAAQPLGVCVQRVKRAAAPKIALRAGGRRAEESALLPQLAGDLIFGTQSGEPCFTKIRNLRIWRRYLTDEQEKAVS